MKPGVAVVALAAAFAGCGPERYVLRYQPEGAPVSLPAARRANVYVSAVDDASGGVTITHSIVRPGAPLDRRTAAQAAVFDPPIAAVLKDAAAAELKRLGAAVTEKKEEADRILMIVIRNVSLDNYDDSLAGGHSLIAQRAAIVLNAALTDRSGRILLSETLQGSGEMRRFGSMAATREMVLNLAVADAIPKLRQLFEEPAQGDQPAAAAPAAVPWWETPVSK